MTENNFKLSETYCGMYARLLTNLGESPEVIRHFKGSRQFAVSWPQRGQSFRAGGGVLAVGRAINGANEGFPIADLGSPSRRSAILDKARDDAEKNSECPPLSWVGSPQDKPGTIGSRSAFWRIVRHTARLTGEDVEQADWWSKVAWSNLAKIAPAKTGNPPGWLGMAQGESTWQLIKQEVRDIAPAVVIVIAGGWVPEEQLKHFGAAPRTNGQCVTHSANYEGRRWLFTQRPEYKAQSPFVEEIALALQELQ